VLLWTWIGAPVDGIVAGVHATLPRPVPAPPLGVLRSGLGLVAALFLGGLLVHLVGGAAWAVVAGAFACASGLVAGLGRVSLAAGLAVVAVTALAIAIGASSAPGTRAAFPARPTVEAPVAPEPAGLEPAGAETPETLVRSYYAALDERDFEAAWERLAPAVRNGFGGLAAWRAGYGTTLGHAIEDLKVDGDAVTHVLVASDRTPCGGRTERRFAVTWRLERAGNRLRVAELSAVKLGGADPGAVC
jgi:hypothetical protein